MKPKNNQSARPTIFQNDVWIKFVFNGMCHIGKTYINTHGDCMVSAIADDSSSVQVPFILCEQIAKLSIVVPVTKQTKVAPNHTSIVPVTFINGAVMPTKYCSN